MYCEVKGGGGSSSYTLPSGQTVSVDPSLMSRSERLELCLGPLREVFEDANWERDFILKPSSANKGKGIVVCSAFEQVQEAVLDEPDIREWILQDYIGNPLLLNKRKFHIRVYVLAVGSIKVYVYDEVLVLCSGTKYNPNDVSETYGHITNTAYQAEDPNFKESECVLLLKDVKNHIARKKGGEEGGRITRKIMDDIR